MKILLTGSAGFIGFHTAKKLLARGDTIVGFDNFNEYYDPTLKAARNTILEESGNFQVIRGDLKNTDDLRKAFDLIGGGDDTRVCHLAAQAGVRHSIENPDEFIQDNIQGTNNVMELCKEYGVGGLTYASSSSIYGDNEQSPFSEEHKSDSPLSLYGMTKKCNELQAFTYYKLHGLKSTGLRFFTVYGPYGRPDMALFLFANWITKGEPMQVFGEGKMQRDFTYVDDIADGIIAALDKNYDYEVFNLGGGHTEELMDYITTLEESLGKVGEKEMLPMQQGDVVATSADISKAQRMLGYNPKTQIKEGIPKFVEWYKEYYKV
ncbi:NAD-dependent epimerase/dehydratase family protein [Candidatus Peregrinibacteria bacterium]|jgi:UDP-glucuronate 4-epimerase|nr:NAD-dependent epimerase/dehydratase family protein [Candidatus Peregrinibacteria bacterium]MBT7337990.1 NAD-dependent epimerase/dehydratase family protein [Candidatus Peregrinibacteria bacterium]